ncbi:MAG: hypothetical protein ACD_19C00426G0045 [uncultured bacterium]|nr:MAG: hypothetical protein ACD_19C00426G0045 [uncultured bacterium]
MFDLLVFTQYPRAYAPKRFNSEALLQGLTLQLFDYDKVDVNKLPNAKAVILREPNHSSKLYDLRDRILKHYFRRKSYVLNQRSYFKWSILDKITQHKEFKKAGIPHIPLLEMSEVEYPFIAKNKLGSHGDSVYKIECKEDLDNVLIKHRKADLLFQEFQTSGFDLRVIVLGGRVLGIMKRTPKEGEFLSNYSQGGEIEKYNGDDSAEIEKISIQAAKHFKLDYVGVDLMKGNDGEWKVLEVNRACQFKGFEKATGVNVAKNVIGALQGLTLQS